MNMKIIWFDEKGNVMGYTRTEDDSVESLSEYIKDTTEGLDAPEGWDQYDVEVLP